MYRKCTVDIAVTRKLRPIYWTLLCDAGWRIQNFTKNVSARWRFSQPKNFAVFESQFLLEYSTQSQTFHQLPSLKNVCSQLVSSLMPSLRKGSKVYKCKRFACNLLYFFLSSPQWSAASAQIQSGEFFLHSSPLVRATAATGWPYPRLLSVLPESGWSRQPTESTTPPWGQILWILEFLGKHSVFEIPKGSFRRRAFTSLIFWPPKKLPLNWMIPENDK